ncbi:MAG TPA: tyrosine-type recombinase/integrase [Anaerolineales bacterium]|nr:tyrosine-type recombinase/integrase [Anaerolineales bacterium]
MDASLQRFITYMRDVRGSSPNTLLAYRADLRQFMTAISPSPPNPAEASDITPQALNGYVSWLRQQGYKPATVSRKMAAVRSFLEYLQRENVLADPSLRSGLRPPRAPRPRPRVLSSDELNALLTAPAQQDSPRALRDAAILALLYATGLRAAEAVALRVDDLDLVDGWVTRPQPDTSRLPLGSALAAMRRYVVDGRPHLARRADDRSLFLNQRGQRLSRQGLWLVVKRWTTRAGLGADLSPHSLRHTMAQHLLQQGRSRKEVQQLLGLSSANAMRLHRAAESE